MNNPSSLMANVIEIALQAGRAIMRVYEGEIAVQRKEDNSPLTEADMAAHHIIVNGLKAMLPELPILSEESTSIPFSTRQTWSRYWLVDPLDGTREFIKRNGEFTVNIALIDQGKAVLGVVFAPAKGLLYYADENGAFKQEPNQAAKAITARQLNTSNVTIAGSRSHSDQRMVRFIENMQRNQIQPEIISLGSSLKICLVAEGAADVYPRLGLTSEWDTAAAQAVLEAAGGHLVDSNNQILRYNTKDSLLNPEFFACGASQHNWHLYLE